MSVFHWPPAGLRAFVSRTLRTLAFLGLLLLVPVAAGASPAPLGRAASAPAELVVTFKEVAVLASELSPGGDAVFFSVAREPQGAFNRIVRRSGVEVVDALGEALFEPAEGFVPPKSVWVVADVATGGFAVAAPEGFLLRQVPFPGNGFEAGATGLVDRLRHTVPYLDLLLIRPGIGAWRLQSHDGAPSDRSLEGDGEVLTGIEDLEPLDELTPRPPDGYAEGDVLVIVDPRTLRYAATRLLGPPEARRRTR